MSYQSFPKSNGSITDGYVLTYSAADGYWKPKQPTTVSATGRVFQFGNSSSDISGYFDLKDSAGGTEADITATADNTSGQVLIKSFATQSGSPNLVLLPKGIWDFNFYRYVDSASGVSNLVFKVYTRTSGGTETLLFSATSSEINDTTVAYENISYNYTSDTVLNSTDRIVVKVYAETTSNSTRTFHLVFDGATHTSHIHSPIVGGSFIVGGDLSGNTANATVYKVNGSTIPAGGSLTTGNVLQVNGSSSLTYGPVNLAGGSNYVSGTLPAANQAAQTVGGDLSGTTSSATVAKINATTVSTAGGALTTGTVLRATGVSSADWGALNLSNSSAITGTLPTGNQASQSMGGDVSGTTASATVDKLKGKSLDANVGTVGASQDGYALTWSNSTSTWKAQAVSGGSGVSSVGTFDSQVSSSNGLTISGSTIYAQSATSSNPGMIKLAGDISGTGAIPTVISITGSSGTTSLATTSATLQWAAATSSPTLKQADNTTASATAQTLTIQAANATGATSIGGDVVLKSGTGTSSNGGVKFNIGSSLAAYFDTNKILRLGNDPTSTLTAFNTTYPRTGINYVYGYSASTNSMWIEYFTGDATVRSVVAVWNTSGGATATTGISMQAPGNAHAITGFAGNGIIEQAGSSTSALVFSKINGDAQDSNRATTGRIWQSGAWSIGNASNNNTSSGAQAGLTGALINISSSTGTMTSTSNQATIFNKSGDVHLQGNSTVNFDVGSSLAGYFDANKTFRLGTDLTTSLTLYSSQTHPDATNLIYGYNASTAATARIISGSTSGRALFEANNTSAGTSATMAMRMFVGGSADAITAFQSNGVLEQSGASTSALVFSKIQGDATNRATTGRIWQSGAWGIGSDAANNTSTAAQAGLTGPLVSLASTTGGTLSSASGQGILYNNSGINTAQGHSGVRQIVGTTTILDTTSTGTVITGNATATTKFIVGSSGPSITKGTGAPASSENDGSIYLRTDGTSSTGLYTRQGGAWSAVGGSGFTAGGDLTGTSSSQQVVAITGSAGTTTLATTSATLQWNTATTSPTINQADNTTASATAQNLNVKAQNATGTTSIGGSLFLSAGSGTSSNGTIRLCVDGTTAIQITPSATAPTIIRNVAGTTAFTLDQTSTSTASGAAWVVAAQATTGDTFTGGTMTLQAGSASGATSGTGGALTLRAGNGTTANGNINFTSGGNNMLSITSSGTSAAIGNIGLTINSNATAFTMQHSSSSSGNGATLQLTAQGTSNNGSTGGTLGLSAGSSTGGSPGVGGAVNISAGTGSSTGAINLRSGTNTAIQITPAYNGSGSVAFVNTMTDVSILQSATSTNSATGANFIVQAQNATGTTSTGGALILRSGSGTSTDGYVKLQTASVDRFIISSSQITINPTKEIYNGNSKTTITKDIANVQTTTGTITDLFTWTIANNATTIIDVVITAIKSDLTQGASYKRTMTFRNNAGTVAAIGTVVDGGTYEDNSAWDCTIDFSGTTGRVRVTGATSTTIQWAMRAERIETIP